MEKKFGPKYFEHLTGCKTYGLSQIHRDLWRLFDHGFIADRVPVWSKETEKIEEHEFAIISRTYCEDNEIDNPPEGLRCFRLPWAMGEKDIGTAIMTVIVGATPAAIWVLGACKELPISFFPFLMSTNMACYENSIVLNAECGFTDDVKIDIIKRVS